MDYRERAICAVSNYREVFSDFGSCPVEFYGNFGGRVGLDNDWISVNRAFLPTEDIFSIVYLEQVNFAIEDVALRWEGNGRPCMRTDVYCLLLC